MTGVHLSEEIFNIYNIYLYRKKSLCVFSHFSGLFIFLAHPLDGKLGLLEPRPRQVMAPLILRDCQIPYSKLTFGRKLGEGCFGVVHYGKFGQMEVAIKQSHNEADSKYLREEAEVMHVLSHPRIVRFFGFCSDAPDNKFYLITEYLPNGSLRDYLKTREGKALGYDKLLIIGDQVSSIWYPTFYSPSHFCCTRICRGGVWGTLCYVFPIYYLLSLIYLAFLIYLAHSLELGAGDVMILAKEKAHLTGLSSGKRAQSRTRVSAVPYTLVGISSIVAEMLLELHIFRW